MPIGEEMLEAEFASFKIKPWSGGSVTNIGEESQCRKEGRTCFDTPSRTPLHVCDSAKSSLACSADPDSRLDGHSFLRHTLQHV